VDITVSSRHVEVSPSLREAAIDKIGRLDRYLDGMDRAEVHFSAEHNPRIEAREICEVTIRGPRHVVRAKVAAADQFAAIDAAVAKLEQQLGRAPQESEIAREMGITLAEYQELLGKVRGTQLVYLEDMSGSDGDSDFLDRHVADAEANPLAQLQDERMRSALVDAIKALPEREQYVMSMYYEHDMNLKEIAAVLKVTESRVCQLHSQSIARLRVKLRDY